MLFQTALCALVLFDFLKLGIDDITLVRLLCRSLSTIGGGRILGLLGCIHLLCNTACGFGKLSSG